jgi:succinyl-diaminopimelate desuccinylase
VTSRAVEIARALIRCASVTPNDGGALAVLAHALDGAGFEIERVRFSEPGSPDIDNLYARFGADDPVIVFAGHTDVVPPGDASSWRFDPFSAEIADGMLWGRGAVDMKGGVAAGVAAALAFLERGPPSGSIVFLIAGDEEGPAVNGTKKLLEWARQKGERFDHCLLAEPTNPDALGDMIKIGRRGSLSGTLTVHGAQGHVAYPRLADNPIPALLRLLNALLDAPLDAGTAHFDPSNLEVTSIDVGNPTTNVIPAEAKAAFNIRFNDLWTSASLADEIRARVDRAARGARHTLAFQPCNAEAFLTQPGPFVDLVRDAARRATGRTPELSTSGGTSDARFVKDYCPVVEFGLVGRTMHAVDERTSVADLDALAEIFLDVLTTYFG